MMNYIILEGNLVDKPVYRPGQGDKKSSAWGKIGVYQGKDSNGQEIGSMFVEFTCFGSDADTLAAVANKGDRVLASGRFSETSSVGQDGKTYVNKKISGNAKMIYKNPNAQQAVAQPMQQPQYAQPVQQVQYAQPMQQPAYNQNPWGM